MRDRLSKGTTARPLAQGRAAHSFVSDSLGPRCLPGAQFASHSRTVDERQSMALWVQQERTCEAAFAPSRQPRLRKEALHREALGPDRARQRELPLSPQQVVVAAGRRNLRVPAEVGFVEGVGAEARRRLGW